MQEIRRIMLSYREAEVGGEVRMYPRITGDVHTLNNAQHLVVLIHGYNNDAQAAKDAYEGFHARQRELDVNARYGIGRTFVELYWPGDAAWGFASFLFYMGSIGRAIKTAGRLADYLALNFGEQVRIDIVAHSMGCRLATELLRALASKSFAPEITRIVFMAGALPTFMLERRTPARRLRGPFDKVLRDGAHSLYSTSDRVLALAFPAGQSLAPGEEGFLPVALGHERWVDATEPVHLSQQGNDDAGHGDYWGWNSRPRSLACARNAAQSVRGYLQFPSAGSRIVNARSMVESEIPGARVCDAKREIIARNIPDYA
ncbi:MAG: hypothetical protein B7Y56_08975 [Gallionellales bacterium 35-53-114]|jgi:pimeloyl-ACP methyl ester carboxylesterase|nr:MAG: hypothetical protein B7Y56_08975 [Gallionellales bacterium 35-53-114]OYZ62755.1 MAG: hypothetical protein B7Y04_12830 [Gallionellales bacterium 24-53-125]OZB09831.1 MAG: hypothetical protein B7X61_04730 [Gallionellales bacterium 39-52-133]HQS57604.1 alpha/beta fold hydrolase [Gallionellaceae bacterium]HQS74058.1 alpha/beta fold hydrolase [Gallionellaceae bacterium]